MTELSFTARRVLFIALLFVLGVLAAALPALLGEPTGEHPALRGLAALLIALPAGLFLAAHWGSRGPLPAKEHGLELVTLVAASTIPLLPALFAGVASTEVATLSNLLQSRLVWSQPIGPPWLGFVLFYTAYTLARLKSSVKGERFTGRTLVALSIFTCLACFAASAWRFLQVPALIGLEELEKRALLGVLLAPGVAAMLRGGSSGRGFDARTLALTVGFFTAGLHLAFFTHRYLQPTANDVERILVTSGTADGTMFAATVDHRPDIYGLFSLHYASATPQLELIRPVGTAIDYLIEKVTPTRFGSAWLEPQPDFDRAAYGFVAPFVAESFEVWFRLRWWPWSDFRSGILIEEPTYDWAVSPSGRFAVASTYAPPFDAASTPTWSRADQGTAAVRLWTRASRPRTLIDNLPMTPRILELSEHSVRLMVLGQPSRRGRFDLASSVASSAAPGPAQLGTTTCDLRSFKCAPWKMRKDVTARFVHAGTRLLLGGRGSWLLLDPRTLETVSSLPRCETCSGESDFAHQLHDGRIVRLSLLGRMPNWESRLSAYDAEGRETAVTSLGNVRQTRFAGELDDGTVAILWRVPYAYVSLTNPVFGWTLDSWNPMTGERHRLADDIATFPSSQNDASMIFLDRRGRLVVPAVDGVRALGQLGYPLPLH